MIGVSSILHHKPAVSIIIPTYKRGHLLTYVLEALTTQTNADFEVLMIVKPSGDGTEQVIKEYFERLAITIIIQTQGYVTDALNLGLKRAEGDIIVFLDDDAIPFPNLIQSYVMSYSLSGIGGVAGDVIPVVVEENKICQFKDTPSEIIPKDTFEKNTLFRRLIDRPLKGLENYLLYLSKEGNICRP